MNNSVTKGFKLEHCVSKIIVDTESNPKILKSLEKSDVNAQCTIKKWKKQ